MYVITSASDGLGLELAKLLVKKGETVLCLSRTSAKVEGIEFVECDLTNEGAINQAANKVLERDTPLQALINCAGIYSQQSVAELTGPDLARTYTTNVLGPMLLTARLMERIKKDGSDIVNVASTAGLKANPGEAAYSSSKWAVRGFSQNLQSELKGTPSRVVSFCPGGMRSGMFQKSNAANKPDATNFMATKDVARFLLQILELPKNMEVSEVIVNRK